MNSSTAIVDLQLQANNLNLFAVTFIKYFCCVIIPPSLLGHSISFYIFTRSTLRTNPCSLYFISATLFGLLNACCILPLRLIQTNFSYLDPSLYSDVHCKLIWLFIYSVRSTAFWLIALACVDRYFCSSSTVTIRSWSSIRVVTRVIPITILINVLVYIHVPIFFRLDTVPITLKPACYSTGPAGPYRSVLNYCNLIFFGFAPPLCMLIFGMLTVQQLHRRRRLIVISTNNATSRQKHERQMLRMLFVQVLVYSVTGLVFSITVLVTAVFTSQSSNVYVIAQGTLANAIVGMFSVTGPCLSFYLFTLSSGLFRREFQRLIGRGNEDNRQLRK